MMDALVFAAVILSGLCYRWLTGSKQPVRFRRKSVLTGGEREFFYRLQRALPECVVCPQVAMSALLEPVGMGKFRQAAVDAINGKRVGYAVFNSDMQLIAIVELDHRTRTSRRAAARDAAFASAGIRTVRFQSHRPPSETRIRRDIFSRTAATTAYVGDRSTDIEFSMPDTPWRNTANAHL